MTSVFLVLCGELKPRLDVFLQQDWLRAQLPELDVALLEMFANAALAGLNLRALLHHRQSYISARFGLLYHRPDGAHQEVSVLLGQDLTAAALLQFVRRAQNSVDGLLVAANGRRDLGHG